MPMQGRSPKLSFVASATVAACGLAASASAQSLPSSLDFVPTQAAGAIAVANLGSAMADLQAFAGAAQLPLGGGALEAVMGELDGDAINGDGSAALFFLPGEREPQVVLLMPVDDYGAFVGARGGVGAGVEEIEFAGEEVFVRRAGNGHAAISDAGDLLDAWEPAGGNLAAHGAAAGARAAAAAGDADVIIVGNLASLTAEWREGYEGVKQMAAMFGGPEAAQGFAAIDPIASAFLNDAGAGTIAIDFEADGVTARVLSRFKEGSLLASLFNGGSNTDDLMAHLPKQDFGLALAYDTSSPAFKSVVGLLAQGLPQDNANLQAGLELINNSSGAAFVMGAPTPQQLTIGAGMFVGSAAYFRGDDPAALRDSLATATRAADGQVQEQQGLVVTTTASYTENARKIGDIDVDEWSTMSSFQPAEGAGPEALQAAAQAQQVVGLMFGLSGPGGYVAQTEDGIVMTMARNSEMLSSAVASANAGGGLASDAELRAISSKLPGNRALELYIDADQLLGAAQAFLGPVDPMPPIGFVAASGSGTAEIALHLPPAVIAKGVELGTLFGAMGPQFGGGGQDDSIDF
ncbi:MAG: hypothetical protein AAFX79_02090 [Planctomycetota bacterium]